MNTKTYSHLIALVAAHATPAFCHIKVEIWMRNDRRYVIGISFNAQDEYIFDQFATTDNYQDAREIANILWQHDGNFTKAKAAHKDLVR